MAIRKEDHDAKSAAATEWARCLQDLKNRGLEDVFYICSDGLTGLKDVISEAFPISNIQRSPQPKSSKPSQLPQQK